MTHPMRVIVVGRDAPLWLAAASIQVALAKSGVRVTAVELPSALQPNHVYMSLPPIEALHSKLGLSEEDVLRMAGGTFSLGQYFRGNSEQQAWFHAWGDYGESIDGHDFFDCWLKASRLGLNVPFADFSLAAVAARHGLMLAPDDAGGLGQSRYSYHLPSQAYCTPLKAHAIRSGVAVQLATSVAPEVSEDGGSLKAIAVDRDAHRLEADLFIDASGPEAVLADSLTGSDREDWSALFPADRMLWARAPSAATHGPYCDIRSGAGGWTAMVPVQSEVRVLHLFESGTTVNDQALADAAAAAGVGLEDISIGSLSPGIRRNLWNGNVIALGEAASGLDPIHSASLHALQLGIVHLLSMFPAGPDYDAERAEYNRIMRSSLERIRDFQSAFYQLAPHEGAFWDRGRAASPPQSLSHKIDAFRARGVIAPMEDESFAPDSWRSQFLGSGIMPESWPPATDRVAVSRMQGEVRRMLSSIKAKVVEQPRHDAYLAQLCRRRAA
jgi:tryptophan halogenase